MSKIKLGISTCPNDTFAFHAILEKKIDLEGLEFETELLDVQELNERLLRGDFDVAKASFHAALLMTDELGVLPAGSALGFGVGPLLLAAEPSRLPSDQFQVGESSRKSITLCPGEHTTATLLFKLFYNAGEIRQVIFSEIMPALKEKRADFGVCIHEGRFTWKEQGLALVEDLGTRWEKETQSPLPLGGILARYRLGDVKLKKVARVVRRSIEYGLANRQETVVTMRHYAQEFNDEVLFAHVDLYVNQWTVELGDEGTRALDELYRHAVRVGLVPRSARKIGIVGRS